MNDNQPGRDACSAGNGAKNHTLLLSDLHLRSPDEPAAAWFAAELTRAREQAAQVFILGDLFEAWIGDDAPGPVGQWVCKIIKRLHSHGLQVYYRHGNRDVLLGRDYAQRCGMRILPGPTVVQLRQGPTLLLHGDELCTDDFAYQRFRRQVRDSAWQRQFLSLPVDERLRQARQARAASHQHTQQAAQEIMDVNQDAVARMFDHFGVRHMIHGHTHRPALHRYAHSHGERTRLVLGDWYQQPAPYWLDDTVVI